MIGKLCRSQKSKFVFFFFFLKAIKKSIKTYLVEKNDLDRNSLIVLHNYVLRCYNDMIKTQVDNIVYFVLSNVKFTKSIAMGG